MQLAAEDQYRRGVVFRELHASEEAFVVLNPWDAGSALLLSTLGFAALATTSAGLAFALGRPDGANPIDRGFTKDALPYGEANAHTVRGVPA
jgi:2-methylisocitrate lyase-like PEP mutase family enzyme